jgi:acyl-CoA hydrolase
MSESDWTKKYADKLAAADEAVRVVRAGQRVFIGSGAAEPQTLVEALSLF